MKSKTEILIKVTGKDQRDYEIRYDVTHHMARRMSQRGISNSIICLCLQYGVEYNRQGLTFYYVPSTQVPTHICNKIKKKMINQVIVCSDNEGLIITSYRSSKGPIAIRKKWKQLKRFAA